jgi:pyruvate dehydrogenase E2 component (dihydrolipoamide acetyltransferase)
MPAPSALCVAVLANVGQHRFLNLKGIKMKFIIALFAALGLSVAVAADAKKEEPKKEAPKAEAKKADAPKADAKPAEDKPKVKPVGKDGKPVDDKKPAEPAKK